MDKFELLKKYKELLDSGIIDNAAFEAKKEELLKLPEDEVIHDEVVTNDIVSAEQTDVETCSQENIDEEEKPQDSISDEVSETEEKDMKNNETDNAEETNEEIIKGTTEETTDVIEKELSEEEKVSIYNDALELMKIKSVNSYKLAIEALRKLGDWEDSLKLMEAAEEELHRLEEEIRIEQEKLKEEKKKKRQKVIIIAFIAAVAIGLIIGVSSIIRYALLPDLSQSVKMKSVTIHGMDYKVPETWKAEKTEDTVHRYSISENDNVIAVLDIVYAGESDLDSGDAVYELDSSVPDAVDGLLPNCVGTYDEVIDESSAFVVTVYYVDGKVKGETALLETITSSFDKEGYENPRESLGIKAEYTGDTKAGVVIDSECEEITVTESFDTGIAEGTKELDWTIEEPVTLVAGETSEVILNTESGEKTLEVVCSTLSESQYKDKCKKRDYKDQLREASYGEYIKISGRVLQDCGSGYYRISSSGNYDDVYMVLAEDSNMVEDDDVSIYGVTAGIYTYETVMGAEKKIPSILAKYVDID